MRTSLARRVVLSLSIIATLIGSPLQPIAVGSVLGQSRSEVPAQIKGAVPPLSGFWITHTIQSGTQGMTAVVYAPDGRLFAGLSNGGLRVYGLNSSGIYGWTSINASPGGSGEG